MNCNSIVTGIIQHFVHFNVLWCLLSPLLLQDPDFSASEPENHSPPFYAPSSQASGIAARPLSMSRASSDSVVSVQMQQAGVGSHIPVPPYPRHTPTSCSPLATVQHTSVPAPACSPISAQAHLSTPVWQRTASVPYSVYSQ